MHQTQLNPHKTHTKLAILLAHTDLAVGAPYEGKGAVYIFHGGKKGIKETYSQRISGSDLRPSLKTFGHSLASGIDLDSNGDPDLTVGAYGSDAVVIFR